MKKFLLQFVALCVLLTSLSAQAAKDLPVLTAKVKEIDKYGNVSLTLTEADFNAAKIELGDAVTVNWQFPSGGESWRDFLPVGSSYSDVDNGKMLVLVNGEKVQLAINMGNFAKTTGMSEDVSVVLVLMAKGVYKKEITLRQLKKSEKREDYASDEIFANFRAAKAGKLAENRLYRSCNPVLDDARAPYANALAEKHGVKTVINLADTKESAAKNFGNAKYYAGLANAGNVVFLNMGIDFSDAEFPEKLKAGLVFLAEHTEGPYLVHCNEGKDRAGFIVAMLEALCGATLKEIKADYAISFENYFGVEKNTEKHDMLSKIIVDQLVKINDGRSIGERGARRAVEVYLTKKIGLTKAQIAAIKANLQDAK